MTKQTPSRRYTSLSQLGEALGQTPEEMAAQDRAEAIREHIADETTTDRFHEAFGDVGPFEAFVKMCVLLKTLFECGEKLGFVVGR